MLPDSRTPCSTPSLTLYYIFTFTSSKQLNMSVQKRMTVSLCSKLFGYYLKSRKRPDTSLRTRNPRSFTASPGFKNTKEPDHSLMSQIGWSGARYLKLFFEHFMLLGVWARWLLSFYNSLAFANYQNTYEDAGCVSPVGQRLVTLNGFWRHTCFWSCELAGFCPSTFNSPLRVTKNARRTYDVCGRLNQDLLSETMDSPFMPLES